jgi:Putative adhesin
VHTFPTPEPITVTVEVGVGAVRIEATDRADTTVEVRPTHPDKKGDVTAAGQTRVDYDSGGLSIKGPRGWRQWSPRGGTESIDLHIQLPAGSEVRADGGVLALRASGRLGDCSCKTGMGDIDIEAAAAVHLTTAYGDVVVGRTVGPADIKTGSGGVRVARIEGPAVVKNGNGDTWVGEVTGDLRVSAANGKIAVGRADASVAAKTANGDVSVGDVAHGAVVAQTAFGALEVGIREGVAAWLDLSTGFGTVINDLEDTQDPGGATDTVEVRASSAYGDITIRRAPTTVSGGEA